MLYLENAGRWEHEQARHLITPLQKITLQGIMAFVFVQWSQAVYSIAVEYLQLS